MACADECHGGMGGLRLSAPRRHIQPLRRLRALRYIFYRNWLANIENIPLVKTTPNSSAQCDRERGCGVSATWRGHLHTHHKSIVYLDSVPWNLDVDDFTMSNLAISPCPSRTSRDSATRSIKSSEHPGKEAEVEPLHQGQDAKLSQPKYHKLAIFLLILYIPLVIIPWALTCVLAKRPLSASSYYNQHGLSGSDIDRIEKWVVGVNVLISIGSLITIPVLSTLIAQAAVVYSHQHHKDSKYRFQYLVEFANRGWTDAFTLSKSLKWPGGMSNGARNLLFFAAVTVIIGKSEDFKCFVHSLTLHQGSVQQPLYQILVPVEDILVPTCHDTSYMERLIHQRGSTPCSRNVLPAKEIGWEMEPTQMALTQQYEIFPRFLSELAIASLIDVKSNLWNNASDSSANKLMLQDHGNGAFVAALEQGTSTGVLRQHIMRLNSSVECQHIQRAAFPSPCPGERPFTRDSSHGNNLTRICTPGSRGLSPWTVSRNRQDIVEEIYLDVVEQLDPGFPRSVDRHNWTSNYTLRCTATTTRGYFELGNYHNNNTWGASMETWPSPEDMATNYNDYLDFPDPKRPRAGASRYPSEL